MLKLIVLILVAAASFGFIFFQIGSFFFATNASRSKIDKDIDDLLALASEWDDKLIPLDSNELSLMAHNVISDTVQTSIYYTETGNVYTIYNEPLISYSYRRYTDDKAVLVALTKESDFIFISRKGKIELRINNYNQGVITNEGALISAEGKNLALLDFDSIKDMHLIKINGTTKATLLDPMEEYSENTRLFKKIEDLEKDELNYLTALTIYDTIMR